MPDKKLEIDGRKLNAWRMSERGLGEKVTEEDKRAFEGIRELQKEFQKEYCVSCVNYDSEKKRFIQKDHVNDPKDCKYHWTDIEGTCWNYKKRK